MHLRHPLDDISGAVAAHDVPVNGDDDNENSEAKDEGGLVIARRLK